MRTCPVRPLDRSGTDDALRGILERPDISLVVPQTWENPVSISTANLKDTTVALPVGYTANPSLASGLGACTPAAVRIGNVLLAARVRAARRNRRSGTVEVETPVLSEKLTGNIYIATPFDKPQFDSLLGLYIVVKNPAARDHRQTRRARSNRTP